MQRSGAITLATLAFAIAGCPTDAARSGRLPASAAAATPAPSGSTWPSPALPPPATPPPGAMPNAMPTGDTTAVPAALPSALPSALPTASPLPTRRRSFGSNRAAPPPAPTQTPAPTPLPTETPTLVPTESPTEPPSAPPSPGPSPSAKPALVPLPADQPTIADSIDDPAVQRSLTRPIRELSQIGWMTGTWHARSLERHGDGRSRVLGRATYVFSATMKGRYFFGADSAARDYMYLTFDPLSKRWALMRLANNPSYGMWLSESGWKGNQIEFLSGFAVANGRQYRRRTTIVHKDSRSFGIYDDEQLADGTWTPDGAVELTKQ